MLPFWAAALLGFLIVARVTRFLNSDVLFDPVRDWVQLKLGEGKLLYLLTCPWCASIWVGPPVAALVTALSPYDGWTGVFVAVSLWLGYSYVYGVLATHLDAE